MENAEPTEPMPGKAPGSGTTPIPPETEEVGRKGGRHPHSEREESGRSGSGEVSGTTVEGTVGGT